MSSRMYGMKWMVFAGLSENFAKQNFFNVNDDYHVEYEIFTLRMKMKKKTTGSRVWL